MTNKSEFVIVGVDTHADTHHCAVIGQNGQKLGDKKFFATKEGYEDLSIYINSFGEILKVGVEGTNSYGAGLARHLRAQGFLVCEIIRPTRSVRRRGKSDPLDALAAARAALADTNLPTPKTADSHVESIRYLLAARRSAVKARQAALLQIKSLLVTATDTVRERYRSLPTVKLIQSLSACRPRSVMEGPKEGALVTLRGLARRYTFLDNEIAVLDTDLEVLVKQVNPGLLAVKGFGVPTTAQLLVTAGDNPDRLRSEATFAALCGASPIPASSGKTNRHRLNRGGDRSANYVLHQIVLARMTSCERTKKYVVKRTGEGKSKKEIMRCLKRAVAREVYHHLTKPRALPAYLDLRVLRTALGISLAGAARQMERSTAQLSRIERGLLRDDGVVEKYRVWLKEHEPCLLISKAA